MISDIKAGWFADRDASDGPVKRSGWQPCLQTKSFGACIDIDLWFDTREKCEQFIRDEILQVGRARSRLALGEVGI